MSEMHMEDEASYDRTRAEQHLQLLRLAGQESPHSMSRRDLLRVSAGTGIAALTAGPWGGATRASAASSPIVKPLPSKWFYVYGSNAEMRWDTATDLGYYVPVERFFVRDHTSTPLIDIRTWRLRVFGTGLVGAPTRDNAVSFSYDDLRALPAETVTAFVECAGNGRSFFTTQQGMTVSGTAWKLGAAGVARWRGVRLATVLARAGLTDAAVDVMPRGLDPDFVEDGVNLGRVRRPLPVAKALHDVLLAYEMNGEPLPPDHGFPLRVIVPGWVGVSSIKWVGDIEVSDQPLFSPWNTQFYRLFGPSYPPGGSAPLTHQVVKSAFELPWAARFSAGHTYRLCGRSWSGTGRIHRVEVSVDGGASWLPALPRAPQRRNGWLPWQLIWRPDKSGPHTLLARATDETGATQPDRVPLNTFGYLFGAVVKHPVAVE